MRYDSASKVSEIVWNMRLAELPRAENRAILNQLFNGMPTFDEATAEENGVQINRNFLEGVNLLANGRRQWNRAMLGGGNYFTVTLDSGPPHKRREWGTTITKNINRELKRSSDYMEYRRGMGGTVLLHGIAPANYATKASPFIEQLDVDDLLIPSRSLINFKNVTHFAIRRQLTPTELYERALAPKRNPGWNRDLVKAEIKAAMENYSKLANSWAYQFQPEKIEEDIKGDMGFWGSDAVPTIDIIDFYFREADDGDGWYRRMILDAALSREARTAYLNGQAQPKGKDNKDFLFTSGKRKYANSRAEIIHCQFADCSAVFPQRYHSVRSLGFMLYGVCELQNRLRCKFSEAVFEQLMWFFRTSNQQQFSSLKKALFSHMGVIPEGINFVTAQERFTPDAGLVELQLSQNRQLMSDASASYTQELDKGQGSEKMTATETMARVNSVNALVSGMLNLAYEYESFQDRETCRRFCIADSPHVVVKRFRLACLKAGVPEEMLDVERWNVEPEKVLGGGNKTLEIAQADKLLAILPQLDPPSQQVVKHIYVEANTDDPALAEQLVPLDQQQQVSDATHDAQLAVAAIMMGLPVTPKMGLNHIDYVEALLSDMQILIQKIEQKGGMASPDELSGLQNLGQHIEQHIAIIAQDKNEKERVRKYNDALKEMANMVKAYAQRLQEMMQKQQQNGQQGIDPKDLAKIRGMQIVAQAKAQNMRESHRERTSQRQVQFEMEEKRKEQEHNLNLRRKIQEQQVSDAAEGLKTAAQIHRNSVESMFSE